MKKYSYLIVFFSFIIFSCQREVIDNTPDLQNDIIANENIRLESKITKLTTQTWLNGYVYNEQLQPLASATIECGGKISITDSKGYFFFKEKLTVNKDYAVIKVTRQGYLTGFRTFTPNIQKPSYHIQKIMLLSVGTPQVVSSSGGSVTIDNVTLTFPANSVVKPGGLPYSGNINITARYINPNSPTFPLQIPGILSGLNDANLINALQSFGMAQVELKDAAGNKLEIAKGFTVKIELPASADGPNIIPLWHFNEKYGVWVQQGSATKTGSKYTAEVNHFSIWNLDLEFNSYRLDLSFTDASQNPLSAIQVLIYRQSNNTFVGNYFTDNNGQATLINCPSNDGLVLKSIFQCDTISTNVAPVTQSRSETIILSSSGANLKIYNFSGTLNDCNNSPLTNQPFQILLSTSNYGGTILGVSDSQGRFNVGTIICNTANSAQVQTAAFYNTAYRFSNLSTHSTGNNIYNPKVCDTLIPGPTYQDNQVVLFTDPRLENKVRLAINKPAGTLFYIDVKFLQTLNASFDSIQTLEGIQYCTSLSILKLGSNKISDISLLRTLTSLTELELNINRITDITPLQNLIRLQRLFIDNNQVSSFLPLQNMVSLIYLSANGPGSSSSIGLFTDLSPIQGLTNLETLSAVGNRISNLTPLRNLTRLTNLYLFANEISDLTPLQSLTGLSILEIRTNQISNINPLQNLVSLTSLDLGVNQISNLTPLQNLTRLTTLKIHSNRISDITPLQNLTQLTSLSLSNNLFISDISPIQNLINLTSLSIGDNRITDISLLQNMVNMTTLDITKNQITNINVVQNMRSLNSFFSNDNLIADVTPLQNVTTLRMLFLRNNRIGNNITSLAGLSNLTTLGLSVNNISTIQPIINSFPNLSTFGIITGNSVPSSEIDAFRTSHPNCNVQ
jgi:internalin A